MIGRRVDKAMVTFRLLIFFFAVAFLPSFFSFDLSFLLFFFFHILVWGSCF